jgi:hypothetical protein
MSTLLQRQYLPVGERLTSSNQMYRFMAKNTVSAFGTNKTKVLWSLRLPSSAPPNTDQILDGA